MSAYPVQLMCVIDSGFGRESVGAQQVRRRPYVLT